MGIISGDKGSNDYNDMDRFYDSSDDNRTYQQIMWEEGIYKEGSLRKWWADSFGKNDFEKAGRKAAAFVLTMMFWLMCSMLFDGILQAVMCCACLTAVCAGEMYIFREKKGIRPCHIAYIAAVGLLSVVFYKVFDYVFGQWGYSAFASAYIFMHEIISNAFGYIIYIAAAALGGYRIFTAEWRDNKYALAAAVLFVLNAAVGPIYWLAPFDVPLVWLVFGATAGAMILYIKSKNSFIRNMTFVMGVLALIEILGCSGKILDLK